MDINSINNNQGKATQADGLKKPEHDKSFGKKETKKSNARQNADDKITLSSTGMELSEKARDLIIADPKTAAAAISAIDSKKAEELLK
jgi:hypothetical protein